MTLSLLADCVRIEPLERKTVTPSGIVLPDTAEEKPPEGNVLAMGPGRRSIPATTCPWT